MGQGVIGFVFAGKTYQPGAFRTKRETGSELEPRLADAMKKTSVTAAPRDEGIQKEAFPLENNTRGELLPEQSA